MKKRALISVFHKDGLVEFAKTITKHGWEIISTGGTFKLLSDNGIPCIQVSDVTGFPEILDGRVKTLHPRIHGGLLALRNDPKHMQTLKEQDITPIDMVVVNLYPFKDVSAKPDAAFEDVIEMIDIGGPSMLRSASKNFESVIVISSPNYYEEVASYIEKNEDVPHDVRKKLAAAVFAATADYDAAIARYLAPEAFPEKLTITADKWMELRYGENPHQNAAIYSFPDAGPSSVINAKILWGKPLSYNNMLDAEASVILTYSFRESVCCIVKHNNPCGVGINESPVLAYKRALATDPISAFGGIVSFNRTINVETAKELATAFVEVIIAPGYEPEALKILQGKKNVRILEIPYENSNTKKYTEYKSIRGGILMQEADTAILNSEEIQVVTKKKPTESEMKALLFAWNVVKIVKSNAIVIADATGTIGIGAGQMSRVDSVRFSVEKAADAKLPTENAILASDAFFPFRDSIEEAHKVGIAAIIQPGGSVRDQEVIDACDELGIAMIFTGIRHFRH